MSEIGKGLRLAIKEVGLHAQMCGDALKRLAIENKGLWEKNNSLEKEIEILKAENESLKIELKEFYDEMESK